MEIRKFKLVNDLECSICLDKIKPKDAVGIKHCKHIFHKDCIKEWVNLRNNCPICRTVVKRTFLLYEKGKFYSTKKKIVIDDYYFYIIKIKNKIIGGRKKNKKDKKNNKQKDKKKNKKNNKIDNNEVNENSDGEIDELHDTNNQENKREKMLKEQKKKLKLKNELIKKQEQFMKLFEKEENYYYLLRSIRKIHYKGKHMWINIALDRNTSKILKFKFKNIIDTINCFKLINDNIKKNNGIRYNR